MTTTVVFGGGPTSRSWVAAALHGVRADAVIAADSGLIACAEAGVAVDLVVGDMDSVPAELLAAFEADGVPIERHSSEKDATDLELAMDRALSRLAGAPDPEIRVIASGDGRLDHLLAMVTLVGSPRYREVSVEAWLGGARVLPVHDRRRIHAAPDATVTLLALHGAAHGVTATGLRWPLVDRVLDANSTLGVSNVLLGETAEITVGSGVVTVVVPGPDAPVGNH